jgi:hypothetical protein
VAAESTEFIAQTHINGDTVNAFYWRTRGDRQTPFIQPGFYISVTKTHDTFSFRASNPETALASGQTRLSLNGTQFGRIIQKTG